MCEFTTNEKKCCYKKKHGNYCFKHRREYLLNNDIINIERFSNKSSDYLKNDIINTLLMFKDHLVDDKIKNLRRKSKNELYILLEIIFKKINKYNEYKSEIIFIQKMIRGYNIHKKYKIKLNRNKCNNTSDFYTFDEIHDIDDKFFYFYEDDKHFTWGFDIRSLDKLITMKQDNPYNREKIPPIEITKCKERINQLKTNNEYEPINDDIKYTKKQIIKQNVVDLFSQIGQFGYECNIDWFMKLNIFQLKKLYRLLEDIWNYRLQLSQEIKNSIVPPNGLIFNISISTINGCCNKLELQGIILNELTKFNRSNDVSNHKLGYMYFLIGLGGVSSECYLAHYQWLMYIN